LISERQGIEIDYCPECRGVWLDRGELDKIIERSSEFLPEQKKHYDDDDRNRSDDKRMTGKHDHDYDRSRKKKSILGDLFDF
jgi:Zn-finger nucleic acid-binding protein